MLILNKWNSLLVEEMRNANKILFGKPEREKTLKTASNRRIILKFILTK
jgi:hypothetical protein